MNIPRSRRVMLALAAVAFGMSACGDSSTSTGSPSTTIVAGVKPAVIKIAGTGSTRGVSAAAEAAPAADAGAGSAGNTASKIYAANVDYVYDGETPTFDGPAGAWYFPVGAAPSDEQLRSLGAAFGFTDAPRTLPEDQGGGWAFGATDGTGAGLQVSPSATLDWWYYPAPGVVTPVESCAVAVESAVDPSADPAVDPAADPGAVPAPPAVAPPEPCPAPTPPGGVPNEADALAKARDLFTAIGLDLTGYDLAVMGDEWGRTVTITQLLDGHRSPVAQSVGYGENGTVTWAGGVLGTPVRSADYPRVTVADAVQRLNDQSAAWGPLVRGAAIDLPAEGPIVGSAGGAPIEPSVGAPGIAVVPVVCPASGDLAAQSGGAGDSAATAGAGAGGGAVVAPGVVSAADSGPAATAIPPVAPDETVVAVNPAVDVAPQPGVDCGIVTPPTPVTVHLNGVTESLTMVWATDNTVWLLPAYDFTSADGGRYQVNAVADGYIENVPVEGTPVLSTEAPVPGPESIPVDDGAPTVDRAATLVGMVEEAANNYAIANGWTLRVTERDGESLPVTDDFSTTRVNIAVQGDKVTTVLGFG